jgi:hypothetical protein
MIEACWGSRGEGRFASRVLLITALAVCCWLGTASGTVVHVPGDSPTIGEAMAEAGYGDTILVAPGMYLEHGIAVRNGVYLTSEAGPEETRIKADSLGRVFFCEDLDHTTVIEGFTIREGSPVYPDSFGGGILCVNSSPTIRGNIITSNTALFAAEGAKSGGGIACVGGSPTIVDNEIRWNEAFDFGAGIYVGAGSTPLIEQNSIHGNHVMHSGGGIAIVESCPTLRENILSRNAAMLGAGVSITRSDSVLIECNDFAENINPVDRGGGIAITENSSSLLILNEFFANSADEGAGLYSDPSSSIKIVGSAFTDNRAGLRGGAIFSLGNLFVERSRIARNSAGDSTGGVVCAGGNRIHLCHIYDNEGFAVYNWVPARNSIDATRNWWGDATGPYHQLLNPRGQAGYIGEHVRFDPWSLEPEPIVFLDLSPEATVIPRGSDFTYTALITNVGEEAEEGKYAGIVRTPGGLLRLAYGPAAITVPPDSFLTMEVTHEVPWSAPLGTYRYTAKIGTSLTNIWDEQWFSLEVTAAGFYHALDNGASNALPTPVEALEGCPLYSGEEPAPSALSSERTEY